MATIKPQSHGFHIANDNRQVPHYDVVFCITGLHYYLPCVMSLLSTVQYLTHLGMSVYVAADAGPSIHELRDIIVNGGSAGNGGYRPFADDEYWSEWRAFDGQFTYDQIVWIDNDIYWVAEDIIKLLNHPEDVVSGLYLAANATEFVVHIHPSSMTSINQIETLRKKTNNGLIEVFSVGFGFMKVRYGVYESLQRPIYFQTDYTWQMPDGSVIAGKQISEDGSFCQRVRESGRSVYVDPQIVVGHFKRIPIDMYPK